VRPVPAPAAWAGGLHRRGRSMGGGGREPRRCAQGWTRRHRHRLV